MPTRCERLGVLLVVAYFIAVLHNLGGADIIGDDEAREVGIVQDIVHGEWLWPRFNGTTLPDKPILFHWLAAVPCQIAGFSATAVRLPSAAAAAVLIGWTVSIGTELFDSRSGLLAGVLLATMPALFDHASVARPDVLLVLFLTAALRCAFRWWRDGRQRDATLALAVLGAATFAKGPVAPALFGVSVGSFLLWQKELHRVRSLVRWPGVLVFLFLGCGWYVVALAGWGEVFVQQHLVGRYLKNTVGGMVTGEAYSSYSLWHHLFFYPIHVLLLALPWAPFCVLGLWRDRKGRMGDPRQRFLLCWGLAPVIVFTPAAYKLRYYVLPSLPAIALLTAPTIMTLISQPVRPPTRTQCWVACTVGLLLIGVAGGVSWHPMLLWRSDRNNLALLLTLFPAGAWGALAIFVIGVALLIVSVIFRAWRPLCGGLAAASIAWCTLGIPMWEAHRNRHESLQPFAAAVATHSLAAMPLVFYKMESRPVIVYLGRRIPILWHAEALRPPMIVIATEPDAAELVAAGRVGVPLLKAEGRVGNLKHAQVVLAEVREELGSEGRGSGHEQPASETKHQD